MRAAIFNGPGSIEIGERPDPRVEQSTDAVVRVVMACVCGSDLWYYRGESAHAIGSIGHEFIGVVEDVGDDVSSVAVGDLVVAPFIISDMSCPHCRHGSTISCAAGGSFGNGSEGPFGTADSGAHDAIDAAYHAKYDRYGPKIVGSVVGADAHNVTIRLVPAGED